MDRCYNEFGFFAFCSAPFVLATRPHRLEPPWAVTDETMRKWLKQAVKRAGENSVYFSISVTPHMFRHSYTMHTLYHRQSRTVIQALAGHKEPRSMEVYCGCLRWTQRPRWPRRLAGTGVMQLRFYRHCRR